jgi:hypothetical protein
MGVQALRREQQRLSGSSIEPMSVVDQRQNRMVLGRRGEEAHRRHADRKPILGCRWPHRLGWRVPLSSAVPSSKSASRWPTEITRGKNLMKLRQFPRATFFAVGTATLLLVANVTPIRAKSGPGLPTIAEAYGDY